MIEVEGPDGVIYEFPEGTPESVMRDALAKVYGGPTAAPAAAPPEPVLAPSAPIKTSFQVAGSEPMGQGFNLANPPGLADARKSPEAAAMAADMARREVSTAGDVAASLGSGMARGGAQLLGLPGTIGDLLSAGATKGINALLGTELQNPQSALSGGNLQGLLGAATGGATEYAPKTTAGEYAGTVGEFLPGAMLGGAGSALRYGVIPGLASEAAGQVTEGSTIEPYARFAAAVAAPMAVGALGKAISPFGGADAERLKLAKVLDDYGVPVTAGQRTGSDALRKAEAGTGGAARIDDAQAEAFTSAVLKTAGIEANKATPEVIDEAFTRIGKVFDDAVAGVDVTPDAQTVTQLSEALGTFRQLAPRNSAPPIFEAINKQFVQSFRTGNAIPASTLKVWRSNLSKLTTSADAATRAAALEALDVVDNAMSSSLIAAGRQEAVAALEVARGQYRNLLAISSAASRAGEGARLGILSPAAVRSALVVQGKRAFATGKRGDLGEVARAAEAVLSPLPTVLPGGVRAVQGLASGALGAAGYGAFGLPGLAAAILPGLGKEAMMTRPVQAWLANQALNSSVMGGKSALMAPGLLAQ